MATAPVKKPGLIRAWAGVLILLFIVAAVAVVPLVIQPWVRGLLISGLARAGLDLDPTSALSVSLLGARLHGEHIRLTARGEGHEVARIERLDIDLALFDTLRSGQVIIESLVATGMTGDLRKRGTWSPIPGDTTPAEGEPPTDWSGWYRRASDAWKKHQQNQEEARKQQEEEAKKPPSQRTPVPPTAATAADWPTAIHYHPTPVPGGPWTRVLIRTLAINGGSLALPHETPLQITGFTVSGAQLTNRQEAGEIQTLHGELQTNQAGTATVDWRDAATGEGKVGLAIPAFPLALLSDPTMGGERFRAYGATGSAAVRMEQQWQVDDALSGELTATITGLRLDPTAAAGAEVSKAASVINRLNGRPVTWPVRFGGTLSDPQITDSGVETVIKGAAADALKGAVQDEASKRLEQLKQQHGDKLPNMDKLPPAAASAAGAVKGLLNNSIFGR